MKASSIALFFKGIAMGTVDIVPGVSGSTVAVLLGIYERFIAALKNIDIKLIKAIFRPFAHKFNKQSRSELKTAAREADLPWLLTLLAGLATAFIIASFVIPALMERFPQIMRGVFFGLVLGSIITPMRTIQKWKIPHCLIVTLFAAGFFFLLGLQVTAPTQTTIVTAMEGDTLESICLQAPCFNAPADVLKMPENAALSGIIESPQAVIPAGSELAIPSPYVLYCLMAGFFAICAMLLPGISGSFTLLVLGCYYFMLNTGKGLLTGLAHGQLYGAHALYLACFAGGALIGIALFSRVLTWLLKKHRDYTLAAIIGILLGCLRAVWPYRVINADGISQNIFPDMSTPLLWQTIFAVACGLTIVVVTVIIQNKMNKKA